MNRAATNFTATAPDENFKAPRACFHKHCGALNFEPHSSQGEAIARIVAAAAENFANERPHAVVSDDISPGALECFKKALNVSVCDFSKLSEIDRLIQRETVLIYFELPSFERFRVYDFEDIKRFSDSFNIQTCVGFSFTDPYCANTREILRPDHIIQFPSSYFLARTQTAGWAVLTKNEDGAPDGSKAGAKEKSLNEEQKTAETKNGNEFKNAETSEDVKCAEGVKDFEYHVNRSFSNARRLYSELKKSSKTRKLEVIYTEKSDHPDYKIIRRALRESGCFVRVNGESECISELCGLLSPFFGEGSVKFYEYLNIDGLAPGCGSSETFAARLKCNDIERESILFKTGPEEMESVFKTLNGILS